MNGNSQLPLIDINSFTNSDQDTKSSMAQQIAKACEQSGFLLITGHGIADDLLKRAFAVSTEFFALSQAIKQRWEPTDAKIPRGYQRFASRNLAATYGMQTPPDLREQFFLGPINDQAQNYQHIAEAERFYAANIWPDTPLQFRPLFSELYAAFEALGTRLMSIFAVALGLPENFFDDKINRHFSTLTTNLYPAIRQPVLADQQRTGAHTDFGSLTILARTPNASGLQIRNKHGEWCEVANPSHALVVNLGDMMARWTNDRWRSTIHRVVAPTTESGNSVRQSIGYFLHPNYDAEVRCLPGCFDANHVAKYPPIRAGDHMRAKLEKRVTGITEAS